MRSHPAELTIPPVAKRDKNAREMVRAWIADEGLHCTIDVLVWPRDRECIGWGILLSDICRHVADAFHREYGADKESVMRQIRTTFNDELDSPTAEAKGDFQQ